MKTKLYKLMDGSHTRGEGGRKATYESTDPERNTIRLTEEEYRFMRHRVEAIDSTFDDPKSETNVEPTPDPEPVPEPEPQAEEVVTKPKTEPDEQPTRDWSSVLAGNLDAAREAIANLSDPEEVHNLAQQEADGKNRKGVLTAAQERLEELEGGGGDG